MTIVGVMNVTEGGRMNVIVLREREREGALCWRYLLLGLFVAVG